MSYEDNGYVIIENFLTRKSEHDHYLDVAESVYQGSYNQDSVHYEWNDTDNLNKVIGAVDFEPEFLKLASHPKLVETARQILNTKDTIDCYISKFFPMKPQVGVSTFMHQDNYYFRGDPKKIVSCAVYLQDTNKENGCLRLVKDSHKQGIFPHNTASDVHEFIRWIDEEELKEFEILDLELKAPYAVFFDINMVHGCYPNKSNGTRFSLAWEYIETSNQNVPMGQPDEPWFDRNTIL